MRKLKNTTYYGMMAASSLASKQGWENARRLPYTVHLQKMGSRCRVVFLRSFIPRLHQLLDGFLYYFCVVKSHDNACWPQQPPIPCYLACKVFVIISIRKVKKPWWGWPCCSRPSNTYGCVPLVRFCTAGCIHQGPWWATSVPYFMLYRVQQVCSSSLSLCSLFVIGITCFVWGNTCDNGIKIKIKVKIQPPSLTLVNGMDENQVFYLIYG